MLAAALKAVRQHGTGPQPSGSRVALPSTPPSAPPPSSALAMPSEPALPALLDENPDSIDVQREVLFKNMKSQLGLSDESLAKTRAIFEGSRWMGQGNPKITEHPMTRAECVTLRAKAKIREGDARCGAPNMVAVFDPARGQNAESAALCIDDQCGS